MKRNRSFKQFQGFLLLGALSIFIACCSTEPKKALNDNVVFKKISPEESGIDFANKIQANTETEENVFDFDYFYNGAGLATVDINNDGLLDIVFTANQSENKLYLNQGNLTFQDITDQSGINNGKGWSTGVTYADVNQDGWIDLYISQGGPYPGKSSRNLLFINQKDLTFKESSDEYGLADESISSQSAFFDYDKDGDLDCIVMNENILFGTDPSSFYQLLRTNKELLHNSSSHLFQNQNGHFVDVTELSGLLSPTFGLGLIVSDINEDDWLDIYIANDYYVPDALYINKGDGSFDNQIRQYVDQLSFFGMGVDIADIDGDGYQDIFVLDMASTDHYRSKTLMASMDVKGFDLLVNKLNLHYQYMFNSLQLNLGNGQFKNIAQLAGMSKSDWSWTVLMEDFNHNTTIDVFITNGYKKYALDNDTRMSILEAREKYGNNVPIQVKQQVYNDMPSEKLPNLMYENSGGLTFKEVGSEWGLNNPSFSNGAVHADLDNDGDLEIIVNNIDDPAFLYKNMTVENDGGNFIKIKAIGKLNPSFPKVTIEADGVQQTKELKVVRGYLSSVGSTLHFGLGNLKKIDRILIDWANGRFQEVNNVSVNQVITFNEEESKLIEEVEHQDRALFTPIDPGTLGINYRHQENSFDDFELETLLPYKQSTLGPCLVVGDVNGDNLDDLYIGGAVSQSAKLYIQNSSGAFFDNTPETFEIDAIHEDADAIFFDVDNDNDQDLFVVSGGYEFKEKSKEYEDRLYINNGFGDFQKAKNTGLESSALSGKAVEILDFDKDGLHDIIVGNRVVPGQYPKSPSSILYRNTGSELVDVTEKIIPDLLDGEMVNDILVTDFDKDGWEDVIVVGEWAPVRFFRNQSGVFNDVSSDLGLDSLFGWWFSVNETDVNGDQLPDYVIGNLGLNSRYKASRDKPLKIYADDFDDNGTWDIVLSNSYKGNYVPFRGRECSSSQMPFIADEFPTYDLFAKATLEDVYGERLTEAYQKEANEFRSMLLINKGDGFKLKALPVIAQSFPILDSEFADLNGDGLDDMLAVGTIYNTEVETPRLDAGSGLVLYAKTDDEYESSRIGEEGLYAEGNLKSMVSIEVAGELYFIVGRNDDTPVFFKKESSTL